jgi:hypothetical protein
LDDREALAYKLWCEARRMEDRGNLEPATELGLQRASSWFGQASGFERAAWMVLGSHGGTIDAEFFKKADAKRLQTVTG